MGRDSLRGRQGGMPEWPNGAVSKTDGGESPTGVQIPLPPPIALVVQWIERWVPDPKVGGSIPFGRAKFGEVA